MKLKELHLPEDVVLDISSCDDSLGAETLPGGLGDAELAGATLELKARLEAFLESSDGHGVDLAGLIGSDRLAKAIAELRSYLDALPRD